MEVHVVDGTYELFRYHFAPNNRDPEQGATRGDAFGRAGEAVAPLAAAGLRALSHGREGAPS